MLDFGVGGLESRDVGLGRLIAHTPLCGKLRGRQLVGFPLNHSLTVPAAPFNGSLLGTRRTMTALSLREAATAAGTSKSTILRAIQSGRMSAPRTDEGGYAIDPAELFRVYAPVSKDDVSEGRSTTSRDADEGQDAPDPETSDEVRLRIRNARLEGELAALKGLLEAEKRRADELREDRDRWHVQAERFAIAAPIAAFAPATSPAQQLQEQPEHLVEGLLRLFRRSAA